MVLVCEGRRVVGVIERARAGGVDGAAMSLASRLECVQSREDEARLWLLGVAGKLGERMGSPAYAVGGFVRDLMLGRAALDIDLVVEGDGIAFARRLSEETGGVLTVHEGFGTASIAHAGDAPLPTVDVASSRREHYTRAGALPVVSPATWATISCGGTSRSMRWRWFWGRWASAVSWTPAGAATICAAESFARSIPCRSWRIPPASFAPRATPRASGCASDRTVGRRWPWPFASAIFPRCPASGSVRRSISSRRKGR